MRNRKRRYEDNYDDRRSRKRYRRGGYSGGYNHSRNYRSYRNRDDRYSRSEYHRNEINNRIQNSQRQTSPDVNSASQLRPPHDVLLLNFFNEDRHFRSIQNLTSIFGPFGQIIQFVEVEPLTPDFTSPSMVIDFQDPSNIQNTIDMLKAAFNHVVRMEKRGPETRFQTLKIHPPQNPPVPAPVPENVVTPTPVPAPTQQPQRQKQVRPPQVQTVPIAQPPPPPPLPVDPRMLPTPQSRNPVRVEYKVISSSMGGTKQANGNGLNSATPAVSATPALGKNSYTYDPNQQTYYSYPDVANADLSVKPMDLDDSTPSTANDILPSEETVKNTEENAKEVSKPEEKEEKPAETASNPSRAEIKLKKHIVKLGRQYTDKAFKSRKITKQEAKEIIKKLSNKVAKHIMSRKKWDKRLKDLVKKETPSIEKLAKGYVGSYRKRKSKKEKASS